MKNKDIHNPHDKLFRAAMQHPEVAREFLLAHCPPQILKYIDLNTVKVCPNSFIDEELKLLQSDVLLEATLIGSGGTIYILIEHQSWPDPTMPLRTRKYEVKICDSHFAKSKSKSGMPIPLILTIVFYTGKKPYNAPKTLCEMYGDNTELMREINQIQNPVIEVKSLAETELIKNLYSGTMEFIMRPQFRENVTQELPHIAQNLSQLVLEGQGHYVLQLLSYIAAIDNEKRGSHEIIEIIGNNLPSKSGENIVDFAEMLRDEGRQEGWQKGLLTGAHEANLKTAKQLLIDGVDPVFVVRATGLPIEEIRTLNKAQKILES